MQDRPTGAELLEAAADFLESEIMPELRGRKQFHVRVTVNVLRIVQREFDGEEDAVRAELARLASILNEPAEAPQSFAALRETVRDMNTRLADLIREGGADDTFDEVAASLMQTVTEKVRIANPRYLEASDA